VLYHPRDKACPCDGCLGTNEEIAANGGKYLYRHYEKGDGMKACIEAERRGDVNIVIGREGEHEVNTKWSLEEAYKQLAKRCEDVGGLVTHLGQYRLELCKPFDSCYWHLEWLNGKFYRIMMVTEREWWRDED
jgi:hypothetical protein